MRRLIATTTAVIAVGLGVTAAAASASANVALEPAAPASNASVDAAAQGAPGNRPVAGPADLIALLGISSICPISANAIGCGVII